MTSKHEYFNINQTSTTTKTSILFIETQTHQTLVPKDRKNEQPKKKCFFDTKRTDVPFMEINFNDALVVTSKDGRKLIFMTKMEIYGIKEGEVIV